MHITNEENSMKYVFKAALLLSLFLQFAYAVEPLPSDLVAFTSTSGAVLLKESSNKNTLTLVSHFMTQKTPTYCGVASVVMILNSTNRIPPIDSQHDPYRYFNQDDFFTDSVKKIITP